MHKKRVFKSDEYKKARGGRSRWLFLVCEKCTHPVCEYQKDGPGMLKRLYFDRMNHGVAKMVHKKVLVCKKCAHVLGLRVRYEKEDRLAYRLFVGAIKKINRKDFFQSKKKSR